MSIWDLIYVTIPFYIFSIILSYFIIKLKRMIDYTYNISISVRNRLNDVIDGIDTQISNKVSEILASSGREITIPRYKIVELKNIDRTSAFANTVKWALQFLEARAKNHLKENEKIGSVLIEKDVIKYSKDIINDIIAILSIVYSKKQKQETFTVNVYKGAVKIASYIKISGDMEVPVYLYGETIVYEPGDYIRIDPPPEKLIVLKAELP